VFAPIAAYRSGGMSPQEVGEKTRNYVHLDFGKIEIGTKFISGQIIYIDDFGNVITNIAASDMFKHFQFGEFIRAFDKSIPFFQTYGCVEKRKLLALIGSHGFLEIAVNGDSAAKILKVGSGDTITIKKD
jgi:hypothetical protein